jgi:peptidoglycan/LPS O-acetylase OafA/YrhL
MRLCGHFRNVERLLNEPEQARSSRFSGIEANDQPAAAMAGRAGWRQIRQRVGPLFTHPNLGLSDGNVNYFYGVDLIRGLAALSIIFWHYHHFFTASYPTSKFPAYGALWLLYDHGGNAVQLFWLISGFTFSSVYTRRKSSTRGFAVHRFARLYPLHLLTLLVVAGLQALSLSVTGHFFIYQDNDLVHFIDQLLLTPGWGTTIRFSFNGPIWTVSVEILIYAVFWVLLPILFSRGLLIPIAIAAVSLALSRFGPAAHILQGGFYFFTGCALLPVFVAYGSARWLMAGLALLPLTLAFAVFAELHSVGIGSILLCAALLLGASQIKVKKGTRSASFMKWMGDNTYGTYLWHVPVQIAILMIVTRFGVPQEIFLRPGFLLFFLLLVIVLSRLSFVCYERPLRSYLSRRLAPSR